MSGLDDNALRLRAYLQTLTPQARRRLREALEQGVVRSDAVDARLILAELRRQADDAAAALVFRPLEPFLVDDDPARRHPGRVARGSLPALWAFVRHDLVPEDAAAFVAAVNDALAADATAYAAELAHAFQERVAAALRALFAVEDELARRRLIMRLGTPRAADEAAALRWTLRGRDRLAALAAHLPTEIPDLPASQIRAVTMLIEDAARPRDVLVHALLTVMRRLAAPWQIVRLAAHAAGATTAARIAGTPYGVVVDILTADIERQIATLGAALGSGDRARAVALIRAIDATIHGLHDELVIPVGSTLGRRLAALGAEAAAVARTALAA